MRAYKFLNQEYATRALKEKRLKVSSLLTLNDPFDCRGVDFPSRNDRKVWSKYVEHVSTKNGIICFSKSWENPVIWSHYADNARGVALGFDLPDTGVMEVEYGNELVKSKGWSDLDKSEKIALSMSVFRRKYEHWRYESEIRYFIDLTDPPEESGFQFVSFGDDLKLKEVVFGPLFPRTDAKKVRELTSQYVNYITTRIAFKTFTITEQKDKRKQL